MDFHVAHAEVAFRKPIKPDEVIDIWCKTEKFGTTSMTISARAERRERDSSFTETVATGRFTFVAVDDANRPRPCTPDKK